MDALSQLRNSLADRYLVEREIGAGGMATVYLARDVRHDRHVALKLLKPELGAVLGVERFLSEIKVTAHLQHPHLLPLFDSGEAGGLLFYVMPFVQGESLRARLDREKQLPVDEAVRIAVAVASALDYAHRHDVVHRDLKPENILLHDGQPVVSDFGIALAVTNAGGTRVTQTGLSLGTPQYMSPEQATGDRLIDARSDIYSLGAVVYEMLTGEPPHTGATVQAIIARVLTDKPRNVRTVRETVPAHVDAAVTKALSKLPADRFATAQQFAEALQHPHMMPVTLPAVTVTAAVAPTPTRGRAIGMVAPWGVAALAIAWAIWLSLPGEPEAASQPTARFVVDLPPGLQLAGRGGPSLAVSPDGSQLVFNGSRGGVQQLWVRSLDDPEPKPIPGTEGGAGAFFSADGRWIGFVSEGRLKKVQLSGGRAATVAEVGVGGGAWNGNDVVVIGGRAGRVAGLRRIPAAGGAALQITMPDTGSGERVHTGPHFLPDDETLVFTIVRQPLDSSTLAVATAGGRITSLGQPGLAPRYVASGHLVFTTFDGTIVAAPFDARRHMLTGSAVPVVEDIASSASLAGGVGGGRVGGTFWGVSRNGTLAYVRGAREIRMVLVTREGVAQPLTQESLRFRRPRVSPDGTRITVESQGRTQEDTETWLYHMSTRTLQRLTFGGGNSDAVWTPDGKRIVFSGRDGGDVDLYWQPADGSGQPERLLARPGAQYPFAFTPDGNTLIIDDITAGVGGDVDIMALGMSGDRTPRDILATPFSERLPALSPDGKWMAYTSNETGAFEVYVRPFPGPGAKYKVSESGGDEPAWSLDGRELYYRDEVDFIAASIQTSPAFAITSRAVLFPDRFVRSANINYAPLRDGRFVMLQSSEETLQLVVVTNWTEELKRRVAPTARP